ncbi:MAG: MBL fold metallo-hydrolase [Gammaproteobacteria bacterium SG8_11]|nr:MAG: MBL fold metallo-hydrolase [Gammaproteobacteria bacterium SG8_11]
MRFASLGSGSRGNSLVVQHQKTTVLIDCGFSIKEVKRRLASLQLEIDAINAIVVTHEHTDHISGVGGLARKFRLPVYSTRGTCMAAPWGEIPEENHITPDQSVAIGELEFWPFPVPHDARQPCQYVISNGDCRLGILTDTGSITPHITSQMTKCDAMVLECNHDLDLLYNSDYPEHLKQRITSYYGHLSNQQAADLIRTVDASRLKHLIAAHLSEKNNTSSLVRQVLSDAMNCSSDWINVIDQNQGLGWRDV